MNNDLGPRPAGAAARERLSAAQRAVLDALAELGGARPVAEVAHHLGQHPNTVREHLEALATAGVAARSQRRAGGRGRPATLYRPTLAATPAGPEYAVLAEALITYLSSVWGPEERRGHAVAAGRAWGQALRRHHLVDSPDRPDREGEHDDAGLDEAMAVMSDVLGAAGFGAHTTTQPDGSRRTELVRCPVVDLARRHTDIVCGSHLGMVHDILDDSGVDRARARLEPFALPGACLLHLAPRQ